MGWAYGKNANGREVGYSVEATCDEPGCKEDIDRGLAYVCGNMHDGDEYGCGDYFCSSHLYYVRPLGMDHSIQLCEHCSAGVPDEEDENGS
jgi:hypothetical protein